MYTHVMSTPIQADSESEHDTAGTIYYYYNNTITLLFVVVFLFVFLMKNLAWTLQLSCAVQRIGRILVPVKTGVQQENVLAS